MGCYGIGVGRAAACIMEAHHDDYGPIWPITVAPWKVQVCCMRSDDADCKATTDMIYETLQNKGIETIYDDRNVRAGAMFADADLIGAPVRVTVGPKALANGEIELSTRDKSVQLKVPKDEIIPAIEKLIDQLYADINVKVQDRI